MSWDYKIREIISMPNWNSKELINIKKFIILFTKVMNEKKTSLIKSVFDKNANMHRGMANVEGVADITKWYNHMWNSQGYGNAKFILKDASAGILPDGTAKCILWFEINIHKHRNEYRIMPKQKQVHIETLDIELIDKKWKIKQCFGIGYDPKDHKKYFKK